MNKLHFEFTEVTVIGNGPSGITTSYLLSGHLPFYDVSNPIPNEILHLKLLQNPTKSILDQDFEYLSQCLEGRSSNPVSLLFDSLHHPNADCGDDLPSSLRWVHDPSRKIPHVVLGNGTPGGFWQQTDESFKTLTIGSWMELPDSSFRRWSELRNSSCKFPSLNQPERPNSAPSNIIMMDSTNLAPSLSVPSKLHDSYACSENDRVKLVDIRDYYTNYVHTHNIEQNFKSFCVVKNCRKVHILEIIIDFLDSLYQSLGANSLTCKSCKCNKANSGLVFCCMESALNTLPDIFSSFYKMASPELKWFLDISTSFSKWKTLPHRDSGIAFYALNTLFLRFIISSKNNQNLDMSQLFPNDYIWETKGVTDKRTPRCKGCGKVTGFSAVGISLQSNSNSDLSYFQVYSKQLVMASGMCQSPRYLNISGEDLSYVTNTIGALRHYIESLSESEKIPLILVVGAGLSAADCILYAKANDCSVLHVFPKPATHRSIVYSHLPQTTYPEYVQVLDWMKDGKAWDEVEDGPTYQAFPSHEVKRFNPSGYVTLKNLKTKVEHTVFCNLAVVQIGFNCDVPYMEDNGASLVADPSQPISSKWNPILVNPYTHATVGDSSLHALGPLVGETFIRFIQGGALAVAKSAYAQYTKAKKNFNRVQKVQKDVAWHMSKLNYDDLLALGLNINLEADPNKLPYNLSIDELVDNFKGKLSVNERNNNSKMPDQVIQNWWMDKNEEICQIFD